MPFPTGQGQSEYLEQLLVTWQELDVLLCQLGSVWKHKECHQHPIKMKVSLVSIDDSRDWEPATAAEE